MADYPGIKYRAASGFDYEFTFSWINRPGSWRVYIDLQRDYGGRRTDADHTHRLGLGSRPYICWSQPLRTYEDARNVTALWVDATENYIATGVFAPPQNRPLLRDTTALGIRDEQTLRGSSTRSSPRPTSTPNPTTTRSAPGPLRRILERLG